jgi:excinuclease UvrABC helicase subunit UvrB
MCSLMHNDPFADLEIPEILQESLQRHRENLAKLVLNLHSAGLRESEIEASVVVIVDSYKQELLRAVRALVQVNRA